MVHFVFLQKGKTGRENEDAHNITDLQIPSTVPSVKITKTKSPDKIFTDMPCLPHQMTYKNSPN